MRPEFKIYRRRFLILKPMECKKCKAKSLNGWVIYGPPYKFLRRLPTQHFVCKECFPTKYTVNTYFCELYMTKHGRRPPPTPKPKVRQGPPDPMPGKPMAPTRSGEVYEGPDVYDDSTSIRGTIASRTCPSCGHHEIGVRKEKGAEFVQLKLGTKIVGYLISE